MKLFISWSGKTSHSVALVLRNWIPKILHEIDPFVSSEEIKKGNIWNNEIINEIKESTFSIICVTKYNLNSKWLNFEAGALSKYHNNGMVCPFLFKMDEAELNGPLSQFQNVRSDSSPEDFFKLLKSIREAYNLKKPSDETLNVLVVKFYDDLILDLNRITDEQKEDISARNEYQYETNSIFISTPMSAFNDELELEDNSTLIQKLYNTLEEMGYNNIKCPALNINNSKKFNDRESAIVDDLRNLQKAEYFLCIYPIKLASSVLVEIGYALSKSKKCIIIVKDRKDLPFLLQEADKRVTNFKIYEINEIKRLSEFIRVNFRGIFTFDRI